MKPLNHITHWNNGVHIRACSFPPVLASNARLCLWNRTFCRDEWLSPAASLVLNRSVNVTKNIVINYISFSKSINWVKVMSKGNEMPNMLYTWMFSASNARLFIFIMREKLENAFTFYHQNLLLANHSVVRVLSMTYNVCDSYSTYQHMSDLLIVANVFYEE